MYYGGMDAPQTAQWGPCVWRFLHSMAEKVGKITDVRGQRQRSDEEKRCWTNIIQFLQRAMPCPLCRQHFKEYVMRHNFAHIFTGEGRKDALRKWLWDCHTNVRTSKGHPIDVKLDAVPAMYSTYTAAQFAADRQIITDHLRRGMFQRWLIRDDMYGLLRCMEEMWRLS